jgi:hypothetical protein
LSVYKGVIGVRLPSYFLYAMAYDHSPCRR